MLNQIVPSASGLTDTCSKGWTLFGLSRWTVATQERPVVSSVLLDLDAVIDIYFSHSSV